MIETYDITERVKTPPLRLRCDNCGILHYPTFDPFATGHELENDADGAGWLIVRTRDGVRRHYCSGSCYQQHYNKINGHD